MPIKRSPCVLLAALSFSTAALANESGRSAASVARAAEAAARARYEQSEREVEAMLRARKEEIRRETRTRTAAARSRGGDAEESGEPARTPHAASWSYAGENGPERWGKLRPEWAKCGSGNRQSPIDIRDGIQVDLEPIAFDYKPSAFNIIDNGHTVQVNLAPGSRISLTGRSYELLQFHFHRPAEEKINGRGFEMVVHLVHKDAEGRLAVVAVLVENGEPHALIQSVWNNLPLEKNEAVTPPALLDVSQLLPAKRDYLTYMGSLTTPPCSEGVLWIVLKQPVQASTQQIGIFSRLYPMNARPLQPDSGRLIKESS